MKKFKGYVSTGYVGSKRTFEFEVEDDATEDEIDEAFAEEVWNNIEVDIQEVQ